MKKTDLEYIILKLRGAAGLVDALGEMTACYGEDIGPAYRIIQITISDAVKELEALVES